MSVEQSERTLKQLKTQRTQTKSTLTRFKTFFESCKDDNSQLNNLKLRFDRAQVLLSEFETIQTQIETLDESELTSDIRDIFEVNYFNTISEVQTYINQNTATTSIPLNRDLTTPVSTSTTNHRQIRLPKVELPSFSGAYDQWTSFYDLFKSMIHDDETIPEIQKFHYLKSTLKGEAARIIESLQISSDNYLIAWNSLNTRYNNKRLIVTNHINALFELSHARSDSHSSLRQLSNDVSTHIRALKALDQPTESWDTLIIHLVTTKMDIDTKREWENINTTNELASFDKLKEFLDHRCQVLEALNSFKRTPATYKNQNFVPKRVSTHLSSHVACPICQENHLIFQCDKFLKQSPNWRLSQVKDKNLCINCLRPNHQAKQCNSSRCKKCNNLHNTLLHLNNQTKFNSQTNQNSPSTQIATEGEKVNSNTTTVAHHYSLPREMTQIILSTALVIVYDKHNNLNVCRALLDSGSQSHFITEALAKKLNLQKLKTSVSVSGINESNHNLDSMLKIDIKSRYNNFKINLNCLIIPQITNNLPLVSLNKSCINIPKSIKLADPDFHISGNVDMLIGAECFYNLLCVGQIKSATNNQPMWQKTQLGWIASGRVANKFSTNNRKICAMSTKKLDETLEKFWKLEEINEGRVLTAAEAYCEDYFDKTTSTTSEGRFIVSLPIKINAPILGDSKQLALNRFYNLERKFKRDPESKVAYSDFIQEYINLGHMAPVNSANENRQSNKIFYLPHHAVFKESSTTTKLRVVFDGSAKSSNGTALNDIFLTGPVLQQDIVTIISRFRTHTYVMIVDITKMYRQVLVTPEQTSLQRILWRKCETEKIQTYELLTLTYGTTPAAYLAIKCLLELSKRYKDRYPTGSKILATDFYVDDLMTGSNTIESACTIQKELNAILSAGGFELRKWASNEPSLLQNMENNSTPNTTLNLDKSQNIKALGIQWNTQEDFFMYSIPMKPIKTSVTKRSILSSTAQVFDPLGLINPIIVRAKIMIQELWQCKLGWDEAVPISIHSAWKQYQEDIQHLKHLKIPRKVFGFENPTRIEIHGFCDASERAYDACVYVRCGSKNMTHTTRLLCAKSRVAPVKVVSLPRLELCAAVLLAELMKITLESTIKNPHKIYLWSDATIVLAWIMQPSRHYKTFVANRISRIQEISNINNWHHVTTDNNPADIISRGQQASELIDNELWWNGPRFLTEPDTSKWPITENTHDHRHLSTIELKTSQTQTFISTTSSIDNFISTFSSFSRMQRVTAFCLRFINNSRQPLAKRTGLLTAQELENSIVILIKCIQSLCFANEINDLRRIGNVKTNSNLLKLDPFLDTDGLLRVEGRLKLSKTLPYSAKHPILLPAKNKLSMLIISHFHQKHLHGQWLQFEGLIG